MNALIPFFVIGILLISFLTAQLFCFKKVKYDLVETSRFGTIDTLRGFLTIAVFIHHSFVWYNFIQTNKWEITKSNIINQIGQSSLLMFFMITSFLFVSKLLNNKGKEINWKQYFFIRYFRIAPMYFFSVIILFILILFIDKFTFHGNLTEHFLSTFNWIFFTIYNEPFVNQNSFTPIINAGVQWSLKYEWLFYFSLPFISLFIIKKQIPLQIILISLLFIISFFYFNGYVYFFIYAIISGIIAAFVVKYAPFQKYIRMVWFSFFIVFCLYVLKRYDTAYHNQGVLISSTIFIIIAVGNTFFGLLKLSSLKFIGKISYSIYLMHGIILFIVFYYIIGIDKAKLFTPLQFCLTIFCIAPFLILICNLTYTYIEKPFLQFAEKIWNQKK